MGRDEEGWGGIRKGDTGRGKAKEGRSRMRKEKEG
jgi:hypothetical protein